MGFQSNDSFFTTNVTVLRSSDDIVANNLWVFNQMNLFSPPMPRFWGVLMINLLIIHGFSTRGSIFRRVLSKRMQKTYQMTLSSPPIPRFWGVLMIYLLIIGRFSIRASKFCGVLSKGMQKTYQMTLFSPPMPRFRGVLMIYLLMICGFLSNDSFFHCQCHGFEEFWWCIC